MKYRLTVFNVTGTTKIFMRESVKNIMDKRLHQTIICSVLTIQGWWRSILQRREYLCKVEAVKLIQRHVRRYLMLRALRELKEQIQAATILQKWWRRCIATRNFQLARGATVIIQSAWRGYKARVIYRTMADKEQEEILSHSIEEAKPNSDIADQEREPPVELEAITVEVDSEVKKDSSPFQRDDEKRKHIQDLDSCRVSPPFKRDDGRRKHLRPYRPRSDDLVLIPMPDFPQGPSLPTVLEPSGKHGNDYTDRTTVMSKDDSSHSDEGAVTQDMSQEDLLEDTLVSKEQAGTVPIYIGEDSKDSSDILEDVVADQPAKQDHFAQHKNKDGFPKSQSTGMMEMLVGPSDVPDNGMKDVEYQTKISKGHKKSQSFSVQQHDQTAKDKASLARRSYTEGRSPIFNRSLSVEDRLVFNLQPSSPGSVKKALISVGAQKDLHKAFAGKLEPDQTLLKQSKHSPLSFSRVTKNLRNVFTSKKEDKLPTRHEATDSEDSQTEDTIGELLSPKQPHDVTVAKPTEEEVSALTITSPAVNMSHKLKVTKSHRNEVCTTCEKVITGLSTKAYKCSLCKDMFHMRCAPVNACTKQTKSSVRDKTVALPTSPKHRKYKKVAKMLSDPKTVVSAPSEGRNVDSGMEFKDMMNKVIGDKVELQHLSAFIYQKIIEMSTNKTKDEPIVDKLFRRTLSEFHQNMVSSYMLMHSDHPLTIRYRDLLLNFEQTLHNISKQEKTSEVFPVSMGINAFRSFLDEFMRLYKAKEEQFKV